MDADEFLDTYNYGQTFFQEVDLEGVNLEYIDQYKVDF